LKFKLLYKSISKGKKLFLLKNIFSGKKEFYFRLSSLLSSGFDIISAISNLEKNNPLHQKNVISFIKREILKGKNLSEAMKNFSLFSNFEIKSISAGIKSGNLPETLLSLSDYFSFLENIRRNIISGLTYPFILLNLAIIIPAIPTLFLKGFFPFLGKIIIPFIIIYGSIFVFGYLPDIYKKRNLREKLDEIIIKIPFLGKILVNFQVVIFLKTFVILYKAGIDIISSFRDATEVIGNETIKKQFDKNFALLKENIPISEAIKNNQFLPDEVKGMIETGEISGNMDKTIEKVIQYTEEETKFIINQILKVIPVVIYLIVAAYVGYIIISFYSGYIKTINSFL